MAFEPITKSELEEVWRRVFPRGYTVPIEQDKDGQGFDSVSQEAGQFARAAEAINTTMQAYYLKPHSTQTAPPAAGANPATTILTVRRTAPAATELTIANGTVVQATALNPSGVTIEGPDFAFVNNVVFPAGSLSVNATVQCTRPGYQGNVGAGRITQFKSRGRASIDGVQVLAGNVLQDTGMADQFTEQMEGQFVRFIGGANSGTYPRRILGVSPIPGGNQAVVDGAPLITPDTTLIEVEEFADVGLSVEQPTDASGGTHPFLDAIGEERNTPRQFGETDEQYRLRLCTLDDIISPAAITRIANRILSPFGIGFRLKETRDPSGLGGFIWDFSPFDFGSISNGIVLLDELCGDVRFFVLCVGLGSEGEFGAPYDTPYPDNAWDWMFFDGYPVGYRTLLQSLYQAIDKARAAGICWELVLDPAL